MDFQNNQIILEEYISDEQILQQKKQQVDEELKFMKQMEESAQIEIKNLEANIEYMKLKKQETQQALNQQLQAISSQKQEILQIDAKIAFINRKLNNVPLQYADKISEEEIQKDSVYISTLLSLKEENIKLMKQKIDNIRPIVDQEKNLQKLNEELLEKQNQLKEIKNQQKFGDLNKTINNLNLKLEEMRQHQLARKNIHNQILEFNTEIQKYEDEKQTLLNQLQIVEAIYRTYENLTEQQITTIRNLEEEMASKSNNQF